MSTPPEQVPIVGPFDGICFLGGGVRCATTQYAGMAVIMNLLGLTPQQMLAGTKYMSGNSGAGFTISTLLCYTLFVDSTTKQALLPLDDIKSYAQPKSPATSPTPATSDLHGFYKKYWTEPLKAIVANQFKNPAVQAAFAAVYNSIKGKLPFSQAQVEFMVYSFADIGLFTWPNGVAMLALAPFAQYLVGQKFKDMPLANSAKLVVSLGATVVKDTSNGANAFMRVQAPTESTFAEVAASATAATLAFKTPWSCPKGYTKSVSYSWDKKYSDYNYYQSAYQDSSMIGMPFNMFYSFGNPVQNSSATSYLLNPGSSASSSPTLGNVTYTPSSAEDGGSVSAIPLVSVASSKIGESEVLALVSATSSYTGCTLQQTNTPMASECFNNFISYDQPVQVDLATGQLFLNSSDQKSSFKAGSKFGSNNNKLGSVWDTSFGTASSTSFSSNLAHSLKKVATKQMSAKDAGAVPMVPFKDNGIYSKDRVLMNLCDGTNSYDNTGIIPMINAMQVYETPSDLATKTYNILYFDGPDSGDQSKSWPSDDHFAKLFKDTQSGFGLNIFEQDVMSYQNNTTNNTWRSAQFPDPSPGSASSNQVWVDVYYYEGLTTTANDFCNVQAGIKFNILVLAPHSQLNTLYEVPANLAPDATGYEGIDYHANVNAILVECFLDLESRYKLFSNTFNSFACNTATKTCTAQDLKGGTGQTFSACSCAPTMYTCNASSGCVTDPNGTLTFSDCTQNVCKETFNCDKTDPNNPTCKPVYGTPSGKYPNQQACNAACKETYKCDNTKSPPACVVSSDPDATSFDTCHDNCPPAPSTTLYKCINNKCIVSTDPDAKPESECSCPPPKPSSFGSTGGLAAWQVALIVIACVILIVGIALLVWRIKRSKKLLKLKSTKPTLMYSPNSPKSFELSHASKRASSKSKKRKTHD
jgi:hypothetical protein